MMGVEEFTGEQRWVLGLTAGASFIAVMDGMVVTTALDAIRQSLAASLSELHWTMTAYSLSFVALLMAGAALGDRFGRRSMFICGLLLFALASVGCALAVSIGWLVFARASQGAASALLVPAAMTLLATAVTPMQRPRAMGLFSSLTGLAVLSGPVIGGLIVDSAGWRWVFWINVPLCTAIAFLARFRIGRSEPIKFQIDWIGVGLLTLSMTACVWGLSEANASGWMSLNIVAALSVGAGAALAFIAWQRRASNALVPARLLDSFQFRAGNAVCLLMFMSMTGTLIFMAQYFSIAHHVTASGAGWRMMPWTVSPVRRRAPRRHLREPRRGAHPGGGGTSHAVHRSRLDVITLHRSSLLRRVGRAADIGRRRHCHGHAGSTERCTRVGFARRHGQGIRNLQYDAATGVGVRRGGGCRGI
jgi:EmrB/QacA subfamily drug resistance transporter